MVRLPRFLKDGVCYYIQSQGYQNQKIFESDLDYRKYVQLLKKYKLRFQVNIYSYCLVPTDIHLVIHPSDSSKLPLFMQGIHQSYALFFKDRHKKDGRVWGQRYKSALINNDHDLFERIKSVEFIPVKEELSCSPVEYLWSSCSLRVTGSNDIIDFMPPAGPILSDQS